MKQGSDGPLLAALSTRSKAWLAYGLAALGGLALALWTTPLEPLQTPGRLSAFVRSDVATYVAAQRYFLADAWRWPLLRTTLMMPPHGVNIAFADAIPLVLLPAKLIRAWLPAHAQLVTLWMGVLRGAQPVAAVFAVGAAGELRLAPRLAAAAIAASLPSWLAQSLHVALASHFLLLIALGLYFMIVRGPGAGRLWAAAALLAATLLVHVYLLMMVAAVLMAAPLSLALRGERRWLGVFAALVGACVGVGLIAAVLGYGDFGASAGFGLYSMNLLSVLDLSKSSLLPHLIGPVDATGQQATEGYQYLGVGLWLASLIAGVILAARPRPLRKHLGLVAASLALTALALSNRVYLGQHLLISLPAPHVLGQVRASGRFFWPVAYLLAVGAPISIARGVGGRWMPGLLAGLALLQLADTSGERAQLHGLARAMRPWSIDVATLRPLIEHASALDIWPEQHCGQQPTEAYNQLLLLASDARVPIVSTVYLARQRPGFHCAAWQAQVTPLAPGELRIFLPQGSHNRLAALPDWTSLCREAGKLTVCGDALRGRRDLPAPALSPLPLGQTLKVGVGGPGDAALIAGWSGQEPWGVWSDGEAALLALPLTPEPPPGPLRLTLTATGFAPPGWAAQPVRVSVAGQPIADWRVSPGPPRLLTAIVPAGLARRPALLVRLDIGRPASPLETGTGADPRKLGLGLVSLRVDPAAAHGPAVAPRD